MAAFLDKHLGGVQPISYPEIALVTVRQVVANDPWRCGGGLWTPADIEAVRAVFRTWDERTGKRYTENHDVVSGEALAWVHLAGAPPGGLAQVLGQGTDHDRAVLQRLVATDLAACPRAGKELDPADQALLVKLAFAAASTDPEWSTRLARWALQPLAEPGRAHLFEAWITTDQDAAVVARALLQQELYLGWWREGDLFSRDREVLQGVADRLVRSPDARVRAVATPFARVLQAPKGR